MRKQLHLLLTVLFFSVFSACAGSKASSGTSDDTKKAKTVAADSKKVRTEDFSNYRPKVAASAIESSASAAAVMPTHHVNEKVETLLDTLAEANKNIKYAQGYRILAYTGNDRKTAFDLRKIILNQLPEERDYLTYVQPTFKLKIGDFYTRMEANEVLQQIRSIAPNASIVREQVNVNRPR
jgi:hypothetical protein